MYDALIAIGGGIAFGIIAYRAIRIGRRMYKEHRRQRLLDHLDWSTDRYGRRRRA